MRKKIVVIGAGVVGCAVARLLSAYQADVVVIERGHDVAEGASKANSGIVHAGFDAKPGSLKAELNVRGAALYPALSQELDVPFGQPGALVLAFEQEGRSTLERLLEQGRRNGVQGLRILEREALLQMEPQINPQVVCGLHAPTSGLTSPYGMTYALADHAAVNGAEFLFYTHARRIQVMEEGFLLDVEAPPAQEGSDPDYAPRQSQGPASPVIWADILVNCAGVDAARLHNQISERKLEIVPRKGEYYLLDHIRPLPFFRTLFQTPTRMGKGVLVSPTVHGNLLLGPTAQDVEDGWDVATTAQALAQAGDKAKITWPKEDLRPVITAFAGIRAHEKGDDFIVGGVEGVPRAYEAVGIESPGLTAAPAIAQRLSERIAREHGLARKEVWKPYPKPGIPFSAMTLEERVEAVKRNPQQGNLVCRCEEVTEAEIRAAIRRPVGATSIDGVKRRVRAGMGRCQGGFCSPRVMEILAEEIGVSPLEITKSGAGSRLVAGTLRPKGEEEC
ncbi:MAG: NAD(P)/FAD-dependent oxidoreductase [Candidatus Limiplasma sp.]|nr:NAD(P)/FAD-dependent oxidoreductase [Candidatus Limiplasma sp.]